MTEPGFTAEAALYPTSQQYRSAGLNNAGRVSSVLAQSLFCARLGQTCGGIDLTLQRYVLDRLYRLLCAVLDPWT
jgi:hypothetical protein